MQLFLTILFIIVLYIVILRITAPQREKKRTKKCEELMQIIKEMFNKSQYQEILDKINKEKVLKYQYLLPPELRRKVVEIEAECFEKLGKKEEALLGLTAHLSSAYEIKEWPADLYGKWLMLYKTIEPLPVEKFYFCECCGLHPDTKKLLDSAIEKGYKIPIGYPGKSKSALVIHFGPKKANK